jgi:transposase
MFVRKKKNKSGVISVQVIEQLNDKGYEYILGARIKNERADITKKILKLKLKNGACAIIKKDKRMRLIVSFSTSRAKKDKANREKGVRKLEKQIQSGTLTKAQINNKGYNKFLKLEGEIKISLDQDKLKAASKWDGLKGYITNTKLSGQKVIENYKHLWRIEKAFRVSKTDLKIRPIFHRLERRIEAHVCIAFVAYKVYKELERQLKEKKSELSPERAIDIAKAIYSINVLTPLNKEHITKVVLLTEEQKNLAALFGF